MGLTGFLHYGRQLFLDDLVYIEIYWQKCSRDIYQVPVHAAYKGSLIALI